MLTSQTFTLEKLLGHIWVTNNTTEYINLRLLYRCMAVYVEYPLDKDEAHIYSKEDKLFKCRCDTGNLKKSSQVVKLEDEEFSNIISDSKYNICPQCLRYAQGIIA